MIPTGLRRRPQFSDLLQEIIVDPHKIRYPNRDAKRLRDGFIYSQFDEENNKEMLLQQMNFNVNAHKAIMNQMGRMFRSPFSTPDDGMSVMTDLGHVFDPGFLDPHPMDIEQMGAVAPQQQAAAAAVSEQEQAQRLARDQAIQQQRQQTIPLIAQQSLNIPVVHQPASSSSGTQERHTPDTTAEILVQQGTKNIYIIKHSFQYKDSLANITPRDLEILLFKVHQHIDPSDSEIAKIVEHATIDDYRRNKDTYLKMLESKGYTLHLFDVDTWRNISGRYPSTSGATGSQTKK